MIEYFHKLNRQQLIKIAANWGIEDVDASDNDEKIIRRLQCILKDPKAFNYILTRLPESYQDTIAYIIGNGNQVLYEELLWNHFKGDEGSFSEFEEANQRFSLAFRQELQSRNDVYPYYLVPKEVARHIKLPEKYMNLLGFFLQIAPLSILRNIISHIPGAEFTTNNKLLLAKQIKSYLLNPTTLREFILQLPATERMVVEILVKHDGTIKVEQVHTLCTQQGIAKGHCESAIQQLAYVKSILFIAESASKGSHSQKYLVLPKDIMSIIKEGFAEKNSLNMPIKIPLDEVELKEYQAWDKFEILQDLMTLIGLVNAQEPAPLKVGGLNKTFLKQVKPLLRVSDDQHYISFLEIFAVDGGFMKIQGGRFRVESSKLALFEDKVTLYQLMFQKWLTSYNWNEIYANPDIRNITNRNLTQHTVMEIRSIILDLISKLSKDFYYIYNAWISKYIYPVKRLEDLMQDATILPQARSNPKVSLSRVLTNLFEGVLVWMGVIGKGITQRNVSVFALTELGDAIISDDFKAAVEKLPQHGFVDTFTPQPNMEIMAPLEIEPKIFFMLCKIAELKSASEVFIFELNRHTLMNALKSGINGERILDFLHKHSTIPLPENTEVLVKEVAGRYGEISIIPTASIIKASDPMIIEEIMVQGEFAKKIKMRLGEDIALLKGNQDFEELIHSLEEAGYHPRLVDDHHSKRSKTNQVNLTDEETKEIIKSLEILKYISKELKIDAHAKEIDGLMNKLNKSLIYEINDEIATITNLLKVFLFKE